MVEDSDGDEDEDDDEDDDDIDEDEDSVSDDDGTFLVLSAASGLTSYAVLRSQSTCPTTAGCRGGRCEFERVHPMCALTVNNARQYP